MDVALNPEPKWSKIDHLFVALAEGDKAPRDVGKSIQKLIDGSGFKGRTDETITVLADAPRKITLMGLGKRDAINLRLIRTALYAIGKLSRKQHDRSIAVAIPYPIADVAVLADFLSQSDYKYDSYITVNKDGHVPINAVLIPPVALDSKELKRIESEARALRSGVRTVRDLGNAPANLITPARLAERAEEHGRPAGRQSRIGGGAAIHRAGVLAAQGEEARRPGRKRHHIRLGRHLDQARGKNGGDEIRHVWGGGGDRHD